MTTEFGEKLILASRYLGGSSRSPRRALCGSNRIVLLELRFANDCTSENGRANTATPEDGGQRSLTKL